MFRNDLAIPGEVIARTAERNCYAAVDLERLVQDRIGPVDIRWRPSVAASKYALILGKRRDDTSRLYPEANPAARCQITSPRR